MDRNVECGVDDRRLAVSQQDAFKVAPVFPSGINIFMYLPSLALLPNRNIILATSGWSHLKTYTSLLHAFLNPTRHGRLWRLHVTLGSGEFLPMTSSEVVFLDFCPHFHLACAATFFLREHTGCEQSVRVRTPCTSFTRLLFIIRKSLLL
ncbi:hypothetical protein NDU88_012578 [Pleurodeles waltl]|uniref:Uncharacterized protein n=1 Tax=Pleurodeles waltl TaxID=8319 RepID=A0AAV7R6I9_PLEWA|nr:hypothetical protein NDU88_012578 [Pleurodeles waltl]